MSLHSCLSPHGRRSGSIGQRRNGRVLSFFACLCGARCCCQQLFEVSTGPGNRMPVLLESTTTTPRPRKTVSSSPPPSPGEDHADDVVDRATATAAVFFSPPNYRLSEPSKYFLQESDTDPFVHSFTRSRLAVVSVCVSLLLMLLVWCAGCLMDQKIGSRSINLFQ